MEKLVIVNPDAENWFERIGVSLEKYTELVQGVTKGLDAVILKAANEGERPDSSLLMAMATINCETIAECSVMIHHVTLCVCDFYNEMSEKSIVAISEN